MPNIFISYSSKNRPDVTALAIDIDSLGYDVWFDKELTGGHSWWQSILREIRKRDVFLFALSKQSLDSYPCRLEYRYAHDLNKNILPVLISGEVSAHLIPPELSKIQYIDYRQRNADAALRLARALQKLPDPVPLPNPLPETPDIPISQIGLLRERVEARETLNFEQQAGLIFQLKEEMSNPSYRADVLELLRRMQRRDDLLARIAREIDTILVEEDSSPSTPLNAPAVKLEQDTSVEQEANTASHAPPEQPSQPQFSTPSPAPEVEHETSRRKIQNPLFTVDYLKPNLSLTIVSVFAWAVGLYLANDIELNWIGGYGYEPGSMGVAALYVVIPWVIQGFLTGIVFRWQNRRGYPLSLDDMVINILLGGALTIFQIRREYDNLNRVHYGIWLITILLLIFGLYQGLYNLARFALRNDLFLDLGYFRNSENARATVLLAVGVLVGGVSSYVAGFIYKSARPIMDYKDV